MFQVVKSMIKGSDHQIKNASLLVQHPLLKMGGASVCPRSLKKLVGEFLFWIFAAALSFSSRQDFADTTPTPP